MRAVNSKACTVTRSFFGETNSSARAEKRYIESLTNVNPSSSPIKRHKLEPGLASGSKVVRELFPIETHYDPGASPMLVTSNYIRFQAFLSAKKENPDRIAVASLFGGMYNISRVNGQTYYILNETADSFDSTEKYLGGHARGAEPASFTVEAPNLGLFVPLYQTDLSPAMQEVYDALGIKTVPVRVSKGGTWVLDAARLEMAKEALSTYLGSSKTLLCGKAEHPEAYDKQASARIKEYYAHEPSPAMYELARLLGGGFVTVLAKDDVKHWVLVSGVANSVSYVALSKIGAIKTC
jgi:hypothetical protein